MPTKKTYNVLGIMNGTSIDAIDYCLIRGREDFSQIRFLGHQQMSIPKNLRSRLLAAANNKLTTYDLSLLHYDLGELYEKQIQQLPANWKWDLIGLHGQTVHHQGRRATLQIGCPTSLHQVGPVVFDFRSADIAQGGEGAPFAPFFQKQLGQIEGLKNFAFHNLGGISNLSYFNANHVVAFDTGPANILMDLWIQNKKNKAFDRNGIFASRGLPHPQIVRAMLKHPYFKRKPPKSCGREEFNLSFINEFGGIGFKKLSFEDQMATLCELTATSIASSYLKLCPQTPPVIYFYGGGVQNSYLMERIGFHLPDCEILNSEALGWPSQAFEGSLIAFLALARFLNRKVHLPQVTGAEQKVLLGSVYS
ncbi:MAG: anhydro-N-acetylmuramic acid kinase [Bdellovibrionales bacterium]|nr:anhydro-N-acetylmuramic acid kinase [Bdellovibrionales bacterium]